MNEAINEMFEAIRAIIKKRTPWYISYKDVVNDLAKTLSEAVPEKKEVRSDDDVYCHEDMEELYHAEAHNAFYDKILSNLKK